MPNDLDTLDLQIDTQMAAAQAMLDNLNARIGHLQTALDTAPSPTQPDPNEAARLLDALNQPAPSEQAAPAALPPPVPLVDPTAERVKRLYAHLATVPDYIAPPVPLVDPTAERENRLLGQLETVPNYNEADRLLDRLNHPAPSEQAAPAILPPPVPLVDPTAERAKRLLAELETVPDYNEAARLQERLANPDPAEASTAKPAFGAADEVVSAPPAAFGQNDEVVRAAPAFGAEDEVLGQAPPPKQSWIYRLGTALGLHSPESTSRDIVRNIAVRTKLDEINLWARSSKLPVDALNDNPRTTAFARQHNDQIEAARLAALKGAGASVIDLGPDAADKFVGTVMNRTGRAVAAVPQDMAAAVLFPEAGGNLKAAVTGQPSPFEEAIKGTGGWQEFGASVEGSILKTLPLLGAARGLKALGVPESVALGLPAALTPEGYLDPKSGLVMGLMPGAGKAGAEAMEAVLGKIGVDLTSIVTRQGVQQAGHLAAGQALLTASTLPDILSLPEGERGEAFKKQFAHDLGVNLGLALPGLVGWGRLALARNPSLNAYGLSPEAVAEAVGKNVETQVELSRWLQDEVEQRALDALRPERAQWRAAGEGERPGVAVDPNMNLRPQPEVTSPADSTAQPVPPAPATLSQPAAGAVLPGAPENTGAASPAASVEIPAAPAPKSETYVQDPLLEIPRADKPLSAQAIQLRRIADDLEKLVESPDITTDRIEQIDARASQVRERLAQVEQAQLNATFAGMSDADALAYAMRRARESAASPVPSVPSVPSVPATSPNPTLRREEAKAPAAQQAAPFSPKAAKAQKKWLLAEIDKAITDAPKTSAKQTESDFKATPEFQELNALRKWVNDNPEPKKEDFRSMSPDNQQQWEAAVLAWWKRAEQELPGQLAGQYSLPPRGEWIGGLDDRITRLGYAQLPHITIEVPGDGTFSILHTQDKLREFKERAAKFPTTAPKSPVKTGGNARITPAAPLALGKLDAENIAKAAAVAASTDTTRPVINGLWSDGKQTVATNGRWLLRIDKGIGGTEQKPVIVIDGKAEPDYNGPAYAKLKTLPDDARKFPPWRMVIPEDTSPVFTGLDTARLFTVLRQALEATDEKHNSVALYRNADGSLGVSAGSADLAYQHNLQESRKVVAAVDPRYLMDTIEAARRIGVEKLDLYTSWKTAGQKSFQESGYSPVVLRGKGIEAVIMPMRMKDNQGGDALTKADLTAKVRGQKSEVREKSQSAKAEGFTLDQIKAKLPVGFDPASVQIVNGKILAREKAGTGQRWMWVSLKKATATPWSEGSDVDKRDSFQAAQPRQGKASPVRSAPGGELGGSEPAPVRASGFGTLAFSVLRRKASEFLRSLRGQSFLNEDTQIPLLMDRQSVREPVSGVRQPVELQMLSALPDMIRRARYDGSKPDEQGRPDIKAWHHYHLAVEAEGATHQVVLIARELKDGRRFYDSYVVKDKGPAAKSGTTSETLGDPQATSPVDDTPTSSGVKASPARATPGGELGEGARRGGDESRPPEDNPNHSVFDAMPMELPEAVRFVKALTGAVPKVVERIRALGGRAAGIFRFTQGEGGKGRVELRADQADLLTKLEKAEIEQKARDMAEANWEPGDNKEQLFRDAYKHLLDEAYAEARLRNPLQALKVIWHEIGHVADWLPEKMIEGRGNIFGRIASLQRYLKHSLPLDPTKPGGKMPTEAEKTKLRAEALRQLRVELGPIEEIVRKIVVEEPQWEITGLTPKDVLAVMGETAGRETPDLARWFAEQPRAIKAEILRKAMKGILDERLAAMGSKKQTGTRRVEKTVREKVGREPTPAEIKARFAELLAQEIRSRNLADMKTVKAELEPLIAWWRGTEKMEDYFRPSDEMYAEAFSAFINNPAAVEKRAPTYFRLMQNYMDAKPAVASLYREIQNEIKAGTVMKGRVMELRASWDRNDEASLKALAERSQFAAFWSSKGAWRDFYDNVVYHIDRRFGPVYRTAKGYSGEGPMRQAIGDYLYRAAEHERFLTHMNVSVGAKLAGNNLDWGDLGEMLFHGRVANERMNLFNPGGWTSKNSLERLAEMRRTLGEDRWHALDQAANAFRDIYHEQVAKPLIESGMFSKELNEKIERNVWYATFAALHEKESSLNNIDKLLSLSFGPEIGPRIFKQIGFLGDIKQPATATVMKALSLLSAMQRNTAKREVVKMLQQHAPDDIRPADERWTGKRKEAVLRDTDKVGTVVVMEGGEAKAFYVRKLVAEALNSGSPADNRAFALLVRGTNTLKGLFTQLNYAFWPVNFVRDTMGWHAQLPGANPVAYARVFGRALAAARASVGGRKVNPYADDALRRKMLLSKADPQGMERSVDNEYELKLVSFGMDPAQWSKEAGRVHLAVKAWNSYRELGQTFERVNKIAGMIHLDEKFPDLPEWKKREIVHERAGSPDFLQKGASNAGVDLFLMFYNPWKEGVRSVIHAAQDNPYSFTGKAVSAVLAPCLVQAAAATGLFGDDLKRRYRSVPDYDLTNYLIPPPRWVDKAQGKVAYVRLPLWEPARLAHGLLFRMATGRGEGYAQYLGGSVPSMNPMLQTVAAWGQWGIAGKNPYDFFRGKEVLDDTTFTAGGTPAAMAMGKWTWNALGGSIVHRFQDPTLESPPKGGFEEFLRLPVLNNFLGRWIKVSDRGLADEARHITAPIEKARAVTRLAVREIMRKLNDGESFTENERRLFLTDAYAQQYFVEEYPKIMLKRSDPTLRQVLDTKSLPAKAAVLTNALGKPK